MSDQSKWLPTDEEIHLHLIHKGGIRFISDYCRIVRDLLRAAVEKAMAEQEARHKREVIEARLDEIDNEASDAESSPKRGESVCEQWVYDWSRERETQLRAELAALEVKP